MSLEEALKANTTAVVALTAALAAAGAAAAGKPAATVASTAGTPKPATTTKTTGYTARHTKEEMVAVVTKYKEATDMASAKKVIKEVGKADKLGDVADPKLIDDLYDAVSKLLEPAPGEDPGGDGL